MNRLTKRLPDGRIGVEINSQYAYRRNENGEIENLLEYAENPFERLAEYEDTGLTPQEIKDRIKVGKWAKNAELDYACSVCGAPAPCVMSDPYFPPYCEMCGAFMDEVVRE